jgi:hypothetical protein
MRTTRARGELRAVVVRDIVLGSPGSFGGMRTGPCRRWMLERGRILAGRMEPWWVRRVSLGRLGGLVVKATHADLDDVVDQ